MGPPSRPRGASNLWIGVQLVSRSVSTTSLQLWFLVGTLLRLPELSACSQTQLLLLKLGQDLIISLTRCMLREHLFIGMLVRVWRKASSLKLERILLLLKRITKRLDLILVRLRMMKEARSTKSQIGFSTKISSSATLICISKIFNNYY